MKKTLLVVVIVALSSYKCTKNSDKEKTSPFDPISFERSFLDVRFEKDSSLIENSIDLVYPVTLKYNNNKYYVSDNQKSKIYTFDNSWNLIDSTSRGKGRGPGEFLHILDFEIDEENMWVINGTNMSLNKFSLTNEFITSSIFNNKATRLISSRDKIVVLKTGPGKLFSLINKSTLTKEKDFGEFGINQEVNFMSLFGHLEQRREGGFLYIPKYQSSIYFYDENFKLELISPRPDGEDFPETNNTESFKAPKTNNSTAFQTSVYGNNLYVGMYIRDFEGSGAELLDVYNLINGEYIKSFHMPVGCSDFLVNDDKFVCLYKGEIEIYRMVDK